MVGISHSLFASLLLLQSQGSVAAVARAAGEADEEEDQKNQEEDPDYEPECQDWDAMSLDHERFRTHAQRSHARTLARSHAHHSLARKLTQMQATPVHTA